MDSTPPSSEPCQTPLSPPTHSNRGPRTSQSSSELPLSHPSSGLVAPLLGIVAVPTSPLPTCLPDGSPQNTALPLKTSSDPQTPDKSFSQHSGKPPLPVDCSRSMPFCSYHHPLALAAWSALPSVSTRLRLAKGPGPQPTPSAPKPFPTRPTGPVTSPSYPQISPLEGPPMYIFI